MARITVEDCLEQVGKDNRFNLIHLTVKRIQQHRQGEPFFCGERNKEVVNTLREVAAGKVTLTNVDDLPDMVDGVLKSAADSADSEAVTE